MTAKDEEQAAWAFAALRARRNWTEEDAMGTTTKDELVKAAIEYVRCNRHHGYEALVNAVRAYRAESVETAQRELEEAAAAMALHMDSPTHLRDYEEARRVRDAVRALKSAREAAGEGHTAACADPH